MLLDPNRKYFPKKEDIKKRAEIICPSVQENGVAIQLEKMFNE